VLSMQPVLLSVLALYIALKAQKVRKKPLLIVHAALEATRLPRYKASPEDIHKTVIIVCKALNRLGLSGSCLIRALTTGRLLSGHAGLTLNIGFYENHSHDNNLPPEGHAWVCLNGKNMSDPAALLGELDSLQISQSVNLSEISLQ